MGYPIERPAKDEMMRCIARFSDLHRNEGAGVVDADLPGHQRTFMNVLGFKKSDPELEHDVVEKAQFTTGPHISHLRPSFGLLYVEARPDNEVIMHAHDTNETFLVMEGRWRFSWEGAEGTDSIELGPFDVMSFPPFIYRMFRCIEAPEGKEKGLLFTIIEGEDASAQFSPEAVEFLIKAGKLPPEAANEF